MHKVEYVVLDKKVAGAFIPLYQGDIKECLGDDRFCFGAVRDGEPIGLFMSTINRDSVSIDWIYVRKDSRKGELGRRMVKGGVRVIREILGVELVTVCCEDEKLRAFLKKCGFYFPRGSRFYSYRGKLSDLKPLPKIKVPEDTMFRLSELRAKEYKGISLYFESLEDTEIPIRLPIDKNDYLDLPAVYFDNDLLRSVLLFKEVSDSEVSIAFAYAFNQDGRALASLINESSALIRKQYGKDVIISTVSIGPHTEKMMEALFSEIEKKPVYQGVYVE